MKMNEMTADERLALGTLIRVLIRIDGEYSREELTEIGAIALDLGEDEFWEAIDQAGHADLSDEAAMERARAVTRQDARETIFGALLGLAESGGIVGNEPTMLDWLADLWSIEVKPTTDED